jgi:hypothetical protein
VHELQQRYRTQRTLHKQLALHKIVLNEQPIDLTIFLFGRDEASSSTSHQHHDVDLLSVSQLRFQLSNLVRPRPQEHESLSSCWLTFQLHQHRLCEEVPMNYLRLMLHHHLDIRWCVRVLAPLA